MPPRFEWSSVNSIKSISQRALLLQWIEARGSRPLPALPDFGFSERLHDRKQLIVWNVERSEPSGIRFKGLAQGKDFFDIFGLSCVDRYMDDVSPDPLRQFALDPANECVGRQAPVYHITSSQDEKGQTIDCERLLLPFGHESQVTQILISLQLISLHGTFDKKTVLGSFVKHAEASLAVCIAIGDERLQDRIASL